MTDPLAELEESLAYLFELQQSQGQGKFLNPLVEELKNALDDFKNSKSSLETLTKAVTKAYPIIENYADSVKVKQKMTALLGHKAESINWEKAAKAIKEHEHDFISWLSLKIGKDFAALDSEKQVQVLLNKQSEKELRVKLGVHLHVDPDFLFNLAIRSANNFIRLISSRLGYKFEKHQVAKAINHHEQTMIDDSLEPHEQVEEFIDFLNKRLASIGYSIEKLLNDPNAKVELEKMKIMQYYLKLDDNDQTSFGLSSFKRN